MDKHSSYSYVETYTNSLDEGDAILELGVVRRDIVGRGVWKFTRFVLLWCVEKMAFSAKVLLLTSRQKICSRWRELGKDPLEERGGNLGFS